METMYLPRVIIQYEKHAKEVLTGLQELIRVYGEARVSDYRELLNGDAPKATFNAPEFYDFWYGWQELHDIQIIWADGGFVILLPEPIRLDDGTPIDYSNDS